MKKLTSSFTTGAIALVFGILGYQTALLVHRSATARIIANRDMPDTVFINETYPPEYSDAEYTSSPKGENGRQWHNDGKVKQRRNGAFRGGGTSGHGNSGVRQSEHSETAKAIRQNARREAECFRFDPNTVSVEDLVRLGFSPKQAQSIDNYRAKGGRFRRKEDFAKSFVVSEENYERLKSFITIPKIDINAADSAAFDSLPGIGGWYAKKMLEHRKKLGGYSYKEQLMDIKGFDEEKFAALADLITVSKPEAFRLWSLSADSLKLHPYIGKAEKARSIVFFREHNPKESWTIDALQQAGILSPEEASKLSLCRLE